MIFNIKYKFYNMYKNLAYFSYFGYFGFKTKYQYRSRFNYDPN